MDCTSTRLLACLTFALASVNLFADLASPSWYDEGPAVADWHYRAPIALPAAGAVNTTIQLDVDFDVLLSQLGINASAVNMDTNSVRIVRSNGSLAAVQEYTDRVYGGALDAINNNRGEIRFLLEDAPANGTYHLYFDIIGNGAKPSSPATSINGNFEHSNGSTPTGWLRTSANTAGAQNNEVYQTTSAATISINAGCSSNTQNNIDNSPNNLSGTATGQSWHLLGYRDNCEDGNGNEQVQITKTINVPAAGAAGNLEMFFQVQGWDGIQNGNNYDWFIFSVNGKAVNHNNLNINNATNPQLRIDNNRLGRRVYSTTFLDHGWKRARLDLTPYQGSTITFRIESRHSASDNAYRSWVKLDDVSWSVQNANLGTAESYGLNIVSPNDTNILSASQYTITQTLSIQVALDASPTSLSATVYDNVGTPVASGIQLFDDASHGDANAGDGVYSNNGLLSSEPTYTFQSSDTGGNNWSLRVVALDASLSSIGANNGLLHRNGQPNTPESQLNFFNIDEQLFSVIQARLEIQSTVETISDPINGTANPKAIPGASLRYELIVTNLGPDASDNNSLEIIEALPAYLNLCVSSACSATSDPISFDDGASPEPTGLTFNYAANVSFSTDGILFNNSTSPDIDGFDSNITHIRVAPGGALAAPGAGGNPSFIIRYSTRLD
ncbi:MAG: hypothetical protein KUG75_05510 [Pseudomonadales bacterium]|nr:hypothetical protein [Pseudomonadales bacterium]